MDEAYFKLAVWLNDQGMAQIIKELWIFNPKKKYLSPRKLSSSFQIRE